jgi:hypothetical protein
MRPPCASTMARAMDSPNPVLFLCLASAFQYGSKM